MILSVHMISVHVIRIYVMSSLGLQPGLSDGTMEKIYVLKVHYSGLSIDCENIKWQVSWAGTLFYLFVFPFSFSAALRLG